MTAEPTRAPYTLDAAQEAAAWDARLRAPGCDEAERARFRAWREAAPEHAAAFAALQDGLAALKANAGRPELAAMRETAQDARRQARRERSRRRWVQGGAVAAGLALAVGLTAIGIWRFDAEAPGAGEAAIAALDQPPFYATEIGERETVTLADGSVVILNTASRVRVDYSDTERAVTLLNGQALFEVAHGDERAFAVYAGDRRLVALGTAFDVRLAGDEVSVTLVEGRLAVERSAHSAVEAPQPGPADRAELEAGQRLVASAGEAAPEIELADLETATLWREGRVIFEDARLEDAVAELNRYVADPIVLQDPDLAELRINGLFRTGDTRVFLGALTAYYPVETRTRRDGATVVAWSGAQRRG